MKLIPNPLEKDAMEIAIARVSVIKSLRQKYTSDEYHILILPKSEEDITVFDALLIRKGYHYILKNE